MTGKRLWEAEHPYYAQRGNYFNNNCHQNFESWADFIAAEGDSDPDMNLIYRWDWIPAKPSDGCDDDELSIFIVGQRKAIHRSCTISPISRDDEPAVRAWLQPRLELLMKIWLPVTPK